MNPMIYPLHRLTDRHLKLLLLVVACLMGGFSAAVAQSSACTFSGPYPYTPSFEGDGPPPYTFYHADGSNSPTFYRGETIYVYAPVVHTSTCRIPNGATFITPIMPPEATALCTPTNNPFFISSTKVADGVYSQITKKCQILGPNQFISNRQQKFSIGTIGTFPVAFQNGNGTTVNLEIIVKLCVKTDCGNFGGMYAQTGLRNGKADLFDQDGNELYFEDGKWQISNSSGTAYQVVSADEYPPTTGWLPVSACGGIIVSVAEGECPPPPVINFNKVTISGFCEFSGVYEQQGTYNDRPSLVGPNDGRLYYSPRKWNLSIPGNINENYHRQDAFVVISTADVPPTTGWERTSVGLLYTCGSTPPSLDVEFLPTTINNPVIRCVRSACGNSQGIYTQTGTWNERPELYDEDQNRLFYWGPGDPNHPGGWYIADVNNKYIYYSNSNSINPPTANWQAFTGDGISCTNNIGVFENECQPCPIYAVESIAYSSASFCKSITEATATITGSTGGAFTSTPGLSIDVNSGTINPSTSTAGTYTVTYSLGGTNGCEIITETTSVTINELKTPSAAIAASPNGSITAGTSVTFTATPTNGGSAPTYVWKKNDTVIPNETGATLTTTTLTDGDKIKVEMTSNEACASPALASSNEITMAVTTPCPIGGDIWTAYTAAAANSWRSVTYGNGLFVAVAVNGTNRVMTSPDGINWTARTAAEDNQWVSVIYANDMFVAVAQNGENRVMTSPDGINWTARTAAAVGEWYSVTYGTVAGNGLFVAVSVKSENGVSRVMTSPDGITWTARTAVAANEWTSVTYGNGLFVATAATGANRVMTSPDGINWTARTAAEENKWLSVTYGNGLFVAVADGGTNRVMTSPDGINWTARTAAVANSWRWVTYGNGLFVSISEVGTNRVMFSRDGTNWVARTITEDNPWVTVTYGKGLFVALAVDGANRVATSPGGPEANVSLSSSDADNSITPGTSVTFTATPTNGGAAPTYVWKKNDTVIPNETGATLTTTTLANGDKIKVEMTSNDACASPTRATSNEITMAVTNPCLNITNRIYVTPTGTGNGSSWANATNDLQAAIDNTCGVTEIWVAAGTYIPQKDPFGNANPADSRDKTFMLKDGIAIYGGFAGTETERSQRNPATNVTILSGDIGTPNDPADNCYHVAVSISDGASTVLDGFKVTKGTNTTGFRSSITIEGYLFYRASGAGLNIQGSSMIVNNCIFEDNAGYYGGGIYIYTDEFGPVITNCRFINNPANDSNSAGLGIAIDAYGTSEISLTNCDFSANTGGDTGGAVYLYGDGNPKIKFTGCTFSGNAAAYGGAVYTYTTGGTNQFDFIGCTFSSNSSTFGGAVYQDEVTNSDAFTFTNCLFVGNQSTDKGGALYFSDGTSTLTNCTIYGNSTTSTTENSGAIYAPNGLAVVNSILWNNTSAAGGAQHQIDNGSATPNVTYSIVQGTTLFAGTGNSNADPLFVNASDPNGADNIFATADDGLALISCSPALNAGNNTVVTSALDLAKATRIQNTTVDMGAYENANPPTYVTPSVSIVANPSGTIIAGTSVTFTATPTNGGTTPTYVWKKNGNTVGTNSNQYTDAALVNGDKIKVEMTGSEACASPKTAISNEITMAVCTTPTAFNVTGGGSYCAGGTGVAVGLASSQTGVNYQLKKDNANEGNPVAGTGASISFGNQTVGTYTVVATHTLGGCTANMTGSVSATTVTPPAANAGADKVTCVNVAVNLAAVTQTSSLPDGNPTAGEIQILSPAGTWSGGKGSFGNANSPTSAYTPHADEAGTVVTLTWTVAGTAPCANATDQMTVTVNALPAATLTGTTAVCKDAPAPNVTFTGSNGKAPYRFTYKINDGDPQTVATTNGNSVTPAIPTGTTGTFTYTLVSVSDDNTCSKTQTGTAVITVNPLPTATITGTTAICQNTASPNLTFTGANGKAPYKFTYSVNGAGNQTVSTSDGNSATVAVPTNAAGTFTYTLLSVSDDNSCGQTQSEAATVTIKPIHLIALSSATQLVVGCINAAITPITFALSGGATGANVSGLPTGVTSSVANGVLTISGTPSVSGVFNYSITTTGNDCATANASGTITLNTKPTFTLSVNGQSFNEGNNPTLCDTDANPVNGLQLTVNNSCVAGPVLWRSQVGAGAWSDWNSTAPSGQPSSNIAYKYQAACDANCPSTLSGIISLTLNYRAATPQNVSLTVDGTTVNAGESKTICNTESNTLTFNATCASGEILLYSVDGGEYSALVPSQIVDGNFHNYRVRCRKADGTPSCVETESGVMSLKITTNAAAPTVSITPTSNCGTPTAFAGSSSCGTLVTVWYNAATNQALPTLPTTTPNATTSYYARCQAEGGCLSEKSNVVTFTITPVNEAPLVTVSAELVCAGTEVTVSTNCPAGTSVLWNTGVTDASFKVAFNNVTKATYWAKCIAPNGCQSSESNRKTVSWKGFELTFINVGQSQSATKSNDRAAWASQFITPDAGPELDYSTQANPTIYFSENVNKTAPRFWTIHAETCNLGTDGSLTFNLLATPELGIVRSYNTHENNAPYFMYANRAGFTELYAQNHPAYGFFADNGNGDNVYDEGLPKGLYKLGVRYWDQKGQGSIYPSTRQPAGNVLAYQEYWFRIQSKNGVGTGAARIAADNGQRTTDNGGFAQVMPNPVSNTLHLKVTDAKVQKVNVSLLDASGRTLIQRSFVPESNQHQEEFEVSPLSNGIYFLKVNTAEKQATLKVVKVQ